MSANMLKMDFTNFWTQITGIRYGVMWVGPRSWLFSWNRRGGDPPPQGTDRSLPHLPPSSVVRFYSVRFFGKEKAWSFCFSIFFWGGGVSIQDSGGTPHFVVCPLPDSLFEIQTASLATGTLQNEAYHQNPEWNPPPPKKKMKSKNFKLFPFQKI